MVFWLCLQEAPTVGQETRGVGEWVSFKALCTGNAWPTGLIKQWPLCTVTLALHINPRVTESSVHFSAHWSWCEPVLKLKRSSSHSGQALFCMMVTQLGAEAASPCRKSYK